MTDLSDANSKDDRPEMPTADFPSSGARYKPALWERIVAAICALNRNTGPFEST
jgi:hypothetical protein